MPSSRRIIIVFLVFLLLITTASNSFAEDDEKPFIFINSGSLFGISLGTNRGLVKFSEYARQKGFDIDHGVQSDLVTGSPLEGVDVYILFEPNFPMTDADKIVLRQWVRAGGILLTTDFLKQSPVSRFVEEFGVEFGIPRNTTQELKMVPNSPLAAPLNPVIMKVDAGRSLKIIDSTRSEIILKYDDGAGCMSRTISHAGKGEIIVIPCLLALLDSSVSGNIGYGDNGKLAQNLLTYIKSKFSDSAESGYDLSVLTVKFKKGTYFLAGDEIKLIARIKNIGSVQSEETRVAFYIEPVGPATSAVIEIASATVSAINAKKKIKILKKTFLPEELAAGNYIIHAMVDPDGTTADGNTINNSETAKKFIVIQ